MALIKCPDCGKEVSSRAIACPFCGCPIENISETGKIKIKLNLLGNVEQKVTISADNQILWSGIAGQTAEFDLNKPTELVIKYHTNLRQWGYELKHTIDPSEGKRYSITRSGLSLFGKPKFVVTKVDNIDSDK